MDKICSLMMEDEDRTEDCQDNFKKHIKITSANHIHDVTKTNKTAFEHNVAKGDFIPLLEENEGSFSSGTAYFAAYGDRSAVSQGSSEAVTETWSSALYYDGPPNVFFLNVGLAKTFSTFEEKVDAQMQAAFERNDGSLRKVSLRYNSIGVRFPAKVKKMCTY